MDINRSFYNEERRYMRYSILITTLLLIGCQETRGYKIGWVWYSPYRNDIEITTDESVCHDLCWLLDYPKRSVGQYFKGNSQQYCDAMENCMRSKGYDWVWKSDLESGDLAHYEKYNIYERK